MKRYIVRGVVAPHGANYGLVGQYTYISEVFEGYPVWDGAHKVARFRTRLEAQDALDKCNGPLFRLPSPETIEIIEVD